MSSQEALESAPVATREPLRLVLAAGREVQAFARLASLMVREREPVVPRDVPAGDDVVVFVHGLMATAGATRPLRDRLEQLSGVRATSFTYDSRCGVVEVARAIDGLLAELPQHCRVHLVGHSMGGVAVRWHVQEVRRDARVVQTISIAAPFEGARGARWVPGPVGRDIRANSALLKQLWQGASAVELPHLTILGGLDTAISVRTRWPVGQRLVVPDCGHNGLLFHPAVGRAVVERVLASRHTVASSS